MHPAALYAALPLFLSLISINITQHAPAAAPDVSEDLSINKIEWLHREKIPGGHPPHSVIWRTDSR